MIGKLVRGTSALLVYFCVGTLLAQAAGAAYLWQSGRLNSKTLWQLMAVLHGIDLADLRGKEEPESMKVGHEEVSIQEIEAARSLRARDLELRELALANELANAKRARAQLATDVQQFAEAKASFETQLAEMSEGAVAAGQEGVRLVWENIKPKQAKVLIETMVEAGEIDTVVTMLAAMPINKKAKIVAEFKTAEESEMVSRILRLTRTGIPTTPTVDEARQALDQAAAQQP